MEKDEKKAVELYTLAADQGHPRANFCLGVCYARGLGVERNVQKAYNLFERAATVYAPAQALLSQLTSIVLRFSSGSSFSHQNSGMEDNAKPKRVVKKRKKI